MKNRKNIENRKDMKNRKDLLNKNIIVFGGGTLGHIIPALEVSEELNKNGYNVYYICDNTKFKDIFIGKNYLEKIYYFDSPGLNRNKKLKNFVIFFVLLKTFFMIKKKVKEINPSVCIGMGGSISTIGLFASSKFKRIIHEQNAVIGLGNKMIKGRCDLCLSGFEIPGFLNIGNPINEDLSILNKSKTDVLVVSGSNGSKIMNDFFIDNIEKICKMLKKDITIITGKKYYNENISRINEINNKIVFDRFVVRIIPFTNNMNKYYEKAYLVFARAGAGTLSEIFNHKLLSIIVPSPNVTKNHQYHNAKYYYDKEMIELIEEKDLTIDRIRKAYDNIEINKDNMKQKMILNHNIYSRYLFISMIENLLK